MSSKRCCVECRSSPVGGRWRLQSTSARETESRNRTPSACSHPWRTRTSSSPRSTRERLAIECWRRYVNTRSIACAKPAKKRRWRNRHFAWVLALAEESFEPLRGPDTTCVARSDGARDRQLSGGAGMGDRAKAVGRVSNSSRRITARGSGAFMLRRRASGFPGCSTLFQGTRPSGTAVACSAPSAISRCARVILTRPSDCIGKASHCSASSMMREGRLYVQTNLALLAYDARAIRRCGAAPGECANLARALDETFLLASEPRQPGHRRTCTRRW